MKLLPLALAVLAAISNAYGQNRTVAYVDTLATLDARRPIPGETVYVRGASAANDWGNTALPFTYISTSSNTVDRFCRATATGVGRYIHNWDGNIQAFGAVPYHPKYTLAPWGYFATNSAISTGAFSVYCQVDLPASYTQPVGMFEISPLQATNYNTAVVSSFGMRASPQNWGFVFRSTSGSSSAGSTTNDAAVLDSTPAAIAAYAGQTVNIVVTRSGTNAAVYFNGTDVTSLFTFSNPLGWSKPLAFGQDIQTQVGNNVNTWYWPKPLRRFILFNSALNASQAANPVAQSGKLIDFTPEDTTEPEDLTDEINAAGDYVASKGGGRIFFPPGVYNVSGNIRVNQRIWWQGSGSSPYPSVFNRAFRPNATVINLPFGASNFAFYGQKDQGTELCLSRRYLGQLGGYVSSTWLRSKISDLTIVGVQSYSAEGIFLDRVAAVGIENVSFYGIPGHEIRSYGCNNIKVSNCDASAGRGFAFYGGADVMVQENFVDSPKGPALRWALNLSKAINNTFEVSQNPRTTTPVYESITTANLTNDYFVIVTGRDTFKVSQTYIDEATLTGAMYSNSIVTLTTNVLGTWYSGVHPSFNFLVSGDHNLFIGNHGQQGYDGGMKLEGGLGSGGNNAIVGNSFILSGYENPASDSVAAIVLQDSDYNLIANNQLDDRDNSLYSQNGVIGDVNSLYNQFIGNSWNVNNPYTLAAPYRNTIMDAQYVHLSAGNVYMSDGITGNNTNTYYAIRANNASSPKWNANDGTLTATNYGTGQRLLSLNGTYSGGILRAQVHSTSSSQAPEMRMIVNNSADPTNYVPPGTYKYLGGLQFGAYRGNTVNDESIGASIEAYTDSQQWTNDRLHSQLNLLVAPTNSATRISAFQVQFPNASTTNDTPMIIGKFNGSQWLPSSSGFRVTIGTNDSAGSGYRVLRVPNN